MAYSMATTGFLNFRTCLLGPNRCLPIIVLAQAACVGGNFDPIEEAGSSYRSSGLAAVSDDFNRADSSLLGMTLQGHQWVEISAASDHVRIAGNEVVVNYMNPSVYDNYMNVGGFEARDLDMTVRLRGYSETYMSNGRVFGPSWRLTDQHGGASASGYHVRIDKDGLGLYAGDTLLAETSMSIDTNWHDYRVVSIGSSHRVYMDGALMIDVLDETHQDEGYVGLFGFSSIFYADDFSTTNIADVEDSFTRPDSLVVGETPQLHEWVESGDGDEHAQVLAEVLSVHYFNPDSIGSVYTNIKGLEARNVDLTVKLKGYSEYYMSDGRVFGPSWRMSDQHGTWNADGYHLQINKDGIGLYAGGSLIQHYPVAIDTDWHEYRVVSVGRSHQIYMDGGNTPVIDVFDDTFPDDGHVGLYGFYSIFEADDFQLREIAPPARTYPQRADYAAADATNVLTVADDFERPDDAGLGQTAGGEVLWLEEGDGDEHLAVDGGRLRMHYFAGGPVHPNSWAVMDGLVLENVELRGRARGFSATYMEPGRLFGFSYRLQGAGVDHDDPGYHVLIAASGVELNAGTTTVASWPGGVDTSWHDYRVEVIGDRHRVFMDDNLIIDVTDSTYPDAGRVGVAGTYSVSFFDDISVRALPVSGIDPQDLEMTLFYYSVTPSAVPQVKSDDVNTTHEYRFTDDLVETSVSRTAVHEMGALGVLDPSYKAPPSWPSTPPASEAHIASEMANLNTYGNVNFWYITEELRYWETEEKTHGLKLRDWTQTHDPAQRPTMMYSPAHGNRRSIHKELEWTHALVTGVYIVPGTNESQAWARWKVQEALAGVAGQGIEAGFLVGDFHIGTNHGQDGRVPMVSLPCGANYPGVDHEEAYNLVFGTLAEGARGIGVYSHWHGVRTDDDCLDGYAAAFTVLRDPEHSLGRALLHGGRDSSLVTTVTAGAVETDSFTVGDPLSSAIPPPSITLTLPSVAATLVIFEGRRYVIAANSRDDAVTVEFGNAGLDGTVEVLTEGRNLTMTGGAFSDTFAAKDVHLYFLPSH